jgi:hypothetical protein
MFDSPGFSGSGHGVKDDQKLSGARDEAQLRRLTALTQAHVEGTKDGIVPRADGRCHVERAAHRGATPEDHALALYPATTAGQRRDADERRDLLAAELAELG